MSKLPANIFFTQFCIHTLYSSCPSNTISNFRCSSMVRIIADTTVLLIVSSPIAGFKGATRSIVAYDTASIGTRTAINFTRGVTGNNLRTIVSTYYTAGIRITDSGSYLTRRMITGDNSGIHHIISNHTTNSAVAAIGCYRRCRETANHFSARTAASHAADTARVST